LVLTTAAVVAATAWTADDLGKPIFFGFLATLSSTAIVLRLLGDKAQLATPTGRIGLGILLFQDLSIVPFMLLTPFLAGGSGGIGQLGLTMAKAALVVVGVVFAARYVVPPILLRIVRTRSRELFLTFLLLLCLGTAYLTSLAGLSLALGAFLAGLAVSESEYSHQAMAEAIPFRDAFGVLFFVSIGMLMDVSFLLDNPLLVLAVVAAILVVKTTTTALAVLLIRYPFHVALRAGLTLAQVGEFAFVLSREGLAHDLIDRTEYQVFLSASVLSMVLTPLLFAAGEVLIRRAPAVALGVGDMRAEASDRPPLTDHVVIAGYGVNGQNVARALGAAGIAYAILEMNPETVRAARERGEPIHYGDCTRVAVLESVGIERARMFVVAISDAASSRQAVSLARSHSPDLHILVRTRFVAEIEELRQLGANEVIPEEFETSIEIFARVLGRFDVPRNVVLELVNRVRGDLYEMLRAPSTHRRSLVGRIEALDAVEVESLLLRPESPAVDKSLSELDLRATTGATVLAVHRAGEVHANPEADFRFRANDVVVVLGDEHALDAALAFLDPDAPTH
jgi:monovalent cation:H+ antiporter-2, CPA2 family